MPESTNRTQFLRVKDVAEIMDCSVSHIYTAINHGDLIAYRDEFRESDGVTVDRMPWRIKKRDLKTWLERHQQQNSEEYVKEYALSRLRSMVLGIKQDDDTWWRAIHSLEPRMRHVLIRRHGLNCQPRSLFELSEELNISRERIRQLQREAEKELKAAIYGNR